MGGAELDDAVRGEDRTAGARGNYDILILDASFKQSLTTARSLARTGLRVVLGESVGQYRPRHEPPSFRSRSCARALVLPVALIAAMTSSVRSPNASRP